MRQQLTQGVITNATRDHVRGLMSTRHNLDPRFVDVGKALGFLKRIEEEND